MACAGTASSASSIRVEEEGLFYSILPTATQYARNAIFAGMMPSEIEKRHPGKWISEDQEGSKNAHEEEFVGAQLKRLGKDVKYSYHKILNLNAGSKLADSLDNLMGNPLNVIVYNFVDMLSHARTEMEVIRELADDDAAYRSLTKSWFEHSPLFDILKGIAERGGRVVITTDHGTIRVNEPSKVVGDRNTNSNLRYKHGRNLTYENRDVLVVKDPATVFLPKANVSTGVHLRQERSLLRVPEQLQPLRHLLPPHLPTRRYLVGRDVGAVGGVEAEVRIM